MKTKTFVLIFLIFILGGIMVNSDWVKNMQTNTISSEVLCYDEFMQVSLTNLNCWLRSGISGGVGVQTTTNGDQFHPGVIMFRSLANGINSGFYQITTPTMIVLNGSEKSTIIFNVPSITAPNQSLIRMGFIDSASVTQNVDGVFIEITANGTNRKLVAITRSNNVQTNSSYITLNSSSDYYKNVITLSNDGKSVLFELYNSTLGNTNLIWNTTLNNVSTIPNTYTRSVGHGVIALLQGNLSRIATNLLNIDYMKLEKLTPLVR